MGIVGRLAAHDHHVVVADPAATVAEAAGLPLAWKAHPLTLAPIHSVEIRGVKGAPGTLAKRCSAPWCAERAQQRHHLWPKSYLRGQPYEWVWTPWGKTVQNSTGLCVHHHHMVTVHEAAILVEGGHFMWAERVAANGWEIVGALEPQPGEQGKGEETRIHSDLGEGESCPTCGYQKPKRREPSTPRLTSIWGVTVPQDAELGAEVLDEWVNDFAVMLGFGEEASRLKRYHVLAVVLAWASQHKPLLIRDIIESSPQSR
jgi:hypothetical protein